MAKERPNFYSIRRRKIPEAYCIRLKPKMRLLGADLAQPYLGESKRNQVDFNNIYYNSNGLEAQQATD